jgi:thiamine biosynthesis lipoprotein
MGLTRARRRLVRRTVPVMGTIAEIAVVARSERHAHDAITAAAGELYEVQRLMSRFDVSSDIGRANRGAAGGAVFVSSATADVVEAALRWAALPGSRFDPALGRATELWDVAHRTEPPAPAAVDRLAARALHRRIALGRVPGGALVRYADADVALDLGGIAKGYAVDRAVAALLAWGIADALVNAGGDLYALGGSEAGDDWLVGIRSPDDPVRLSGTVRLRDRAVATSGDYEQYFEHDGRRYHHLLDPATAAPCTARSRSVTTAAASCMEADAAATAVFGLDRMEARAVLARAAEAAKAAGAAGVDVVMIA